LVIPPLVDCLCKPDICHCEIRYPGTPPTPPYIPLWNPNQSDQLEEGLHFN
jgi:hypothetical protein